MNNRGNTLVKIIIGVVVLAGVIFIGTSIFMGGVGTGSYTSAQIQARNEKRKGDIDVMAKALEIHYGDDQPNQYPTVKPDWFTLKSIPVDVNGSSYVGVPKSPVASFHICATLEGGSPQYCVDSQHK